MRITQLLRPFVLATTTALLLSQPSVASVVYWGDLGTKIIQSADSGVSAPQDVTAGAGYTADIAVDSGAGQLYWADASGGAIRRVNADGTGSTMLIATSTPLGVALDLLNGKIYWTSIGSDFRDQIQRANLDGSDVETLVTGIFSGDGLAVDPIAGRLYWTDGGSIKVASLAGTGVTTLISAANIRGIDLDTTNGRIYWSEIQSGSLQRAFLDGTGTETLVSTPTGSIYSLVVDATEGYLYWADPTGGENSSIMRSALDGTSVQAFVTGINAPRGLALSATGSVPEPSSLLLVTLALSGAVVRVRPKGRCSQRAARGDA